MAALPSQRLGSLFNACLPRYTQLPISRPLRQRHGNDTATRADKKGIVPFTGLHTALARYNVLNVVGYNVCNVG